MEAVTTALTTGITPTILFGSLALLAPLVITAVVVSFGNHKLGKVVKGVGKGNARI